MRTGTLIRRSLLHYRGIHLAVIAGVAIAVGVLAGSLAVGDSVRGSLRDLVLGRLGATHSVITSQELFRDKLTDLFPGSAPIMVLEGVVTTDDGRRANNVAVYGVDARFWTFNDRNEPPSGVGMSQALARELGVRAGDTALVRVEQFSDIPREFLQGRREDSGRTMRLRIGAVLGAGQLGEFSLRPKQGDVLAVFVPLARLQRDLKVEGRVNTILTKDDSAEFLTRQLRQRAMLDDLGLRLREIGNGVLSLERRTTLLDDAIAQPAIQAAERMGWKTEQYFTYLVNTIRVGDHEIPYSLVTAEENAPGNGLALNERAAQDLGVTKPGVMATLEYFVWKPSGGLATEHVEMPVAAIVPISAGDRDMAPEFPGISDSEHLADWNPPFPVDLKRVRPKDEQYWDHYRTTPKAFLPLKKGQELWGSRFGNLTSIRLTPTLHVEDPSPNGIRGLSRYLQPALDPARLGLMVYNVRAQSLAASQGSTDFGEYFMYFSFFLVVSALLLGGLFFKLGIEQRSKEIGILRTLGWTPKQIRGLFVRQGLLLAIAGGIVGVIGAQIYTRLVLLGLRTFWIGAVGTKLLTLHARPMSLGGGFMGGGLVSLIVMYWTLRGLGRQTPRQLVSGVARVFGKKSWLTVAIPAAIGAAILIAAAAGKMDQAGGFFGSATLFLIALLRLQWIWLAGGTATPRSPLGLGLRNASYHPGRSILCIALISSASFIVIAMDAFRQGPPAAPPYPVMAESELPIYERAALPQRSLPFRLHPGDDTSCLNLYEPRNPRVLGAPPEFLKETRFPFEESVDKADNPWSLLDSDPKDVVPAIADANSITYILHRKVGDEITLPGGAQLRLVAALHDSIFQGELMVSDKNFVRLFPDDQGFRFFLLESEPSEIPKLDEAFSEYGFAATSTAARLAGYHRVENTYLSTFQALGGLGLILGTLGLAAVLLRNVLEQRRELALLRAIGYRTRDLSLMVVAENLVLLAGGLITGTVTALLAILPALGSHSGHVSLLAWSALLPAVLVTGLAASLGAVATVARLPVLETLRAE
jgi:putative ABC transport system permease protein